MLTDILRHGEPVGGARYRGKTDDLLSEAGWQQMADAVNLSNTNLGSTKHDTHTKVSPWTHIISSPLKRCADFARQFSDQHNLELHIEPDFAEINFGDWEGLSSEQIMNRDPERLLQYWDNPADNTPPNGESLHNFKARIITAWNNLLQQHVSTDKNHLLIVTHGGSLRVILSHILDMPQASLFSIDVPYACLSRFQHLNDDKQSQLIFHNGNLS